MQVGEYQVYGTEDTWQKCYIPVSFSEFVKDPSSQGHSLILRFKNNLNNVSIKQDIALSHDESLTQQELTAMKDRNQYYNQLFNGIHSIMGFETVTHGDAKAPAFINRWLSMDCSIGDAHFDSPKSSHESKAIACAVKPGDPWYYYNETWANATNDPAPSGQCMIVWELADQYVDWESRASDAGLSQERIWVDDQLPAGTVQYTVNDSWIWTTANPYPFSGLTCHKSGDTTGLKQHYFGSYATDPMLINSGSDEIFTYVYLDPANPPREIMFQWYDVYGSWAHSAYWGENLISYGQDNTDSRRRIGDLPPTGKWVRLSVPASLVGLGTTVKAVKGMAFDLYDGVASWDMTGVDPCKFTWADDNHPQGTILGSSGNDSWNWITENPTPYYGLKAHQSTLASGLHQHYFYAYNSSETLNPISGDTIMLRVFIDPINPPQEIMLQWYAPTAGSWEHRAYWGENLIEWGQNGTNSRSYMGPLPQSGEWVLLKIPASQVGLEGVTVTGMAFALFDGRVTWDRVSLYH
jgi:hypothetical protein